MEKEEPYVRVKYYDERGDPYYPNQYRAEIIIGGLRFISAEDAFDGNNGCLPEEEANLLAKKVAKILGIEARLKE